MLCPRKMPEFQRKASGIAGAAMAPAAPAPLQEASERQATVDAGTFSASFKIAGRLVSDLTGRSRQRRFLHCRHEDERWPSHAPCCDFYRDPAEQNLILGSYVGSVERPLRLARRFGAAEQGLDRSLIANSYANRRPGLARLLMRLVDDAGLQKIAANWRPPTLVDQIKAVWGAARKVNLDADVPLPQFLCTSPGRMGELVEKIATAPPRLFKRTRPHSVLIARTGSIRAGLIEPIAGEVIPVRGRIAVFGGSVGTKSPGCGRDPPRARLILRLVSWDARKTRGRSRSCRPMCILVRRTSVDAGRQRL